MTDRHKGRTIAFRPGMPAIRASPVHLLERCECTGAEFERLLAAELLHVDGGAVLAEGLLQRMFATSVTIPEMYDTLRALRGAGFRTALLGVPLHRSAPDPLTLAC